MEKSVQGRPKFCFSCPKFRREEEGVARCEYFPSALLTWSFRSGGVTGQSGFVWGWRDEEKILGDSTEDPGTGHCPPTLGLFQNNKNRKCSQGRDTNMGKMCSQLLNLLLKLRLVPSHLSEGADAAPHPPSPRIPPSLTGSKPQNSIWICHNSDQSVHINSVVSTSSPINVIYGVHLWKREVQRQILGSHLCANPTLH